MNGAALDSDRPRVPPPDRRGDLLLETRGPRPLGRPIALPCLGWVCTTTPNLAGDPLGCTSVGARRAPPPGGYEERAAGAPRAAGARSTSQTGEPPTSSP